MSKSATLTKDIRFQQWVAQVQAFQSRPSGMSMTAWCNEQEIAVDAVSLIWYGRDDVEVVR